MAEELKAGCARPTGGPVGETAPEQTPGRDNEKKEDISMGNLKFIALPESTVAFRFRLCPALTLSKKSMGSD